jgi:hypothetical protein
LGRTYSASATGLALPPPPPEVGCQSLVLALMGGTTSESAAGLRYQHLGRLSLHMP